MSDNDTNDDSTWEMINHTHLKSEREKLTEDGLLEKQIITSPSPQAHTPTVMSKVYVLIKGWEENNKSVFLDSTQEEFEFQPGRGEVAKGLQMAVMSMKVGERALIYCGSGYGYSDLRRPAQLHANATLVFDVTLLRFEQEPNLHEMTIENKFKFIDERRDIGKNLFSQKMFRSAIKQYEKALLVYDSFKEENLNSDEEKLSKIAQSIIHANIALCKSKLQDKSGTIQSATNALQLDKQNIKARFARAKAYNLSNDFEEAISDYQYLQTQLSSTTTTTTATTAHKSSNEDVKQDKEDDKKDDNDGDGDGDHDQFDETQRQQLQEQIAKGIEYAERGLLKVRQKQRQVYETMFQKQSLYQDKPTPKQSLTCLQRTKKTFTNMLSFLPWCRRNQQTKAKSS